MPLTPTSPSSMDSSSFEALIMQSETQIRSWSGFSRDTLLRAQSTSFQSSQSTITFTSHDVHTGHIPGEHQSMHSQPPPIPTRAPGRSFHIPKQSLRKRRSPRVLSLRELRAKDSEAQLRSVYELQTLAYLNDDIRPYRRSGDGKAKWSFSESSGEEDIKEEAEEDEQYFMAPET